MDIDEDFVKGLGYYLGDGRMAAPRSLSSANQDIEAIKFFIKWLKKYFGFKIKDIKIKIRLASPNFDELKTKKYFAKKLGLSSENIHSVKQKRKSKPHHSDIIDIWANNASAKKKFDKMIPLVKRVCLNDEKLAIAYIKGMMAAEGSPKYHKKSGSRSVHLKMKNEKEIRYIGNLLNNVIKINSSVLKVKNEEGMWLIIISGIDEITRLNELDIFEIESRKKIRLDEIVKSYKRRQVKRGFVEKFYLDQLKYYNQKLSRKLTAPELAKLIKRDRTRVVLVLRKLEARGLVKSRRRKTAGTPFEFWV